MRTTRIAAVALLFVLALLGVASDHASAATSRPLLKQLKFANGSIPEGVATDSAGNLYVTFTGSSQRIEKFDSEGNPVNFTKSAPYITGNKITGTAEEAPIEVESEIPSGLAVDRTGGPTNGYIYVTAPFAAGFVGVVYAFKPSGEFAGTFDNNQSTFFQCALAINQANGDIHVGDAAQTGQIRRYPANVEPNGTGRNGRLFTGFPNTDGSEYENCALAADPAGNAYAVRNYTGGNPIFKYPAANFSNESLGPRTEIFPAPVNALSYDTASGHLFADRGNDVVEITTAGEQVNSPFGSVENSHGVTSAPGNRVYVQSAANYVGSGSIGIYGPPANLPVVTTESPSEVLQTTATMKGNLDPDGSGPVTKCEFQWGKDSRYLEPAVPCSQATPYNSPTAVTAALVGLEKTTTYHYRVVTTSANGVQVGRDLTFATPDFVADVTTGGAEPVKKDSALLHGSYRGQNLETTYYFEFGKDGSYGENLPAVPVSTGKETGTQQLDPIPVTGLQGATEYHYRLVMTNELGTARGQDQSFVTPPAITDLETGDAVNIGNETAELNGSFTADSFEVHYFFEWGPTEAYGSKTPVAPGTALPPGSGKISVPPVLLEGLQEGGIYHYRIVASNTAGTTVGADRTFKTAEPPQISNLAAKNVTATSADLTGEINPNRADTTYYFEWGPTTSYGNKTPTPDGTVPNGATATSIESHLEDLTVGTTYHFRLVATNKFGTRASGDQVFGFYPPNCPNSQIRQETGSAHVPDCRGYELVSPANARGATIFPLNAPSSGYATHPSRLAFGVAYGEIPESGEPIVSVGDEYVATRSSAGWASKYVGKSSKEANFMGGPPHGSLFGTTGYGPNTSYLGAAASSDLSRLVLYDLGYPAFSETIEPASNTPFVFDSTTDETVGHWPTNLAEVPGGYDFVGWQAFSDDLNHFVFSSNVPFVEGAESFEDNIECCSYLPSEFLEGACCPGPIYDNDTETGSIELISEREDGSRFQGVPIDVSSDGSHILMGETADWLLDVARPLYMRVGGQTIDIAHGAPVRFIEMTADGSVVYFASREQLTADDHDNSRDLFVWEESHPGQVTRVSKGISGNDGDRDNCNLSWVKNCDIQIIDVKSPYGGAENGNATGNQSSDNVVASENGDIYFVSPEQLDGARGSFGQANIYLYRNGKLRFVTSAEPESCFEGLAYLSPPPNCAAGKIVRMQVTPSGSHAAFITKSRITSYDNQGHLEMYEYTPSENRIDCASCRPNSVPPTTDVYGSQNGLFLTEDGRAFFSTEDGIVPADTNQGNDVYEFVEGKAQLISTGLGPAGGFFGFQGALNAPGLVSVSANGLDVYFATYERLVTQDHNGQELKIYDARTTGGFPAEPPKPECAAADECHGAGTVAPESPKDRTSVQLEGNQKHKAKKKKQHKKKKKAHKKSKKAKRGHNRGSGHAG